MRDCSAAKPAQTITYRPAAFCDEDERNYAGDMAILACLDFERAGIGHLVGNLSTACNKDD